jgi:hypothetical protein
VRFAWEAVAFAEIRDLNRHRTGTKYCPLSPVGFYYALDQLPTTYHTLPPHLSDHSLSERAYFLSESSDLYQEYLALETVGRVASQQMRQTDDPKGIYFALLGTQFPFEHTTTADKFSTRPNCAPVPARTTDTRNICATRSPSGTSDTPRHVGDPRR